MTFFTKRYHPPGTPPGTLIERPREISSRLRIQLVDYSASDCRVHEDISVDACRASLKNECNTWIHVEGHPTEAAMRELGDAFGLHPLALEDVLNTGQRPKLEEFEDQLFIVLAMPVQTDHRVEVSQLSLFLGTNYLLSFHEGDFEPFRPLLKRLQDTASRLRRRGTDFLLYSLVDIAIDQGFPVLDHFGTRLEDLEERILQTSGSAPLTDIHATRRELILLRRMLWPQREVLNQLLRQEHLVQEETHIYLRDCYDHSIQVIELVETYRDMTGSMLEIYLSAVSNRMNEVMRVLTMIATVFIPLSFIVGIYGMNFDRGASPWNMPELGWRYGYPLLWGVMIAVVVTMLYYFRRRDWL